MHCCLPRWDFVSIRTGASNVCNYVQVEESELICHSGCQSIKNAKNSIVKCHGNDACGGGSVFTASAVLCVTENSCKGATFDFCSCCDGPGCNSAGVKSCVTDTTGFCAETTSGDSCASYGDPICGSQAEALIKEFENPKAVPPPTYPNGDWLGRIK